MSIIDIIKDYVIYEKSLRKLKNILSEDLSCKSLRNLHLLPVEIYQNNLRIYLDEYLYQKNGLNEYKRIKFYLENSMIVIPDDKKLLKALKRVIASGLGLTNEYFKNACIYFSKLGFNHDKIK